MRASLRTFGRAPAFPAAEPAPSGERPPTAVRHRSVDLVHLARQTFGDKRLETELLRMFARQARQILAAVEGGAGGGGSANPADLLHTLLGSARVVGAGRVAALAEHCYAALQRAATPDAPAALPASDLASLRDAVEDACAFIGAVLEPA